MKVTKAENNLLVKALHKHLSKFHADIETGFLKAHDVAWQDWDMNGVEWIFRASVAHPEDTQIDEWEFWGELYFYTLKGETRRVKNVLVSCPVTRKAAKRILSYCKEHNDYASSSAQDILESLISRGGK